MKKINTLTLNAYRHAVHILKPRHERDKAHHWGTLQTTARLPLARLARCVSATRKLSASRRSWRQDGLQTSRCAPPQSPLTQRPPPPSFFLYLTRRGSPCHQPSPRPLGAPPAAPHISAPARQRPCRRAKVEEVGGEEEDGGGEHPQLLAAS